MNIQDVVSEMRIQAAYGGYITPAETLIKWADLLENGDFWQRCIDAYCVVIPVKAYSEWGADGDYDENKLIGIKFVVVRNEYRVVKSDDNFYMIDEMTTELHDTPEDALQAWIDKEAQR